MESGAAVALVVMTLAWLLAVSAQKFMCWVLREQVGRQHAAAWDQRHLRPHLVQAGHAKGGVELGRVEAQAAEVVAVEPGLADELV